MPKIPWYAIPLVLALYSCGCYGPWAEPETFKRSSRRPMYVARGYEAVADMQRHKWHQAYCQAAYPDIVCPLLDRLTFDSKLKSWPEAPDVTNQWKMVTDYIARNPEEAGKLLQDEKLMDAMGGHPKLKWNSGKDLADKLKEEK